MVDIKKIKRKPVKRMNLLVLKIKSRIKPITVNSIVTAVNIPNMVKAQKEENNTPIQMAINTSMLHL